MLSEKKLNGIVVLTAKEEEEDIAFHLDNKIKLMVAQITNLKNDKENMAALLESAEARNSSSEFIIRSLEQKLCESEAETKVAEAKVTRLEKKLSEADQTVWAMI